MKSRCLILVLCCFTLTLLATAHVSAAAAKKPRSTEVSTKAINPDGDPTGPQIDPTFCSYVCPSGSPCDSCKQGGVFTTCGQYAGHPATDLDGDGVPDTRDNCKCLANANQADCDGDGIGDACDYQDNSWKVISVGTQQCYLDKDTHLFSYTLEFYYQNIYKSACTGQTCYKKYLHNSFSCSLGTDDLQCCLNNGGGLDCGGQWNYDHCGVPRCTF